MKIIQDEKGTVWTAVTFLIIFIWLLIVSVLKVINSQYRDMNKVKMSAAAFHLAEAGITKGLWELSKGNTGYRGEKGTKLDIGAFSVDVRSRNGQFIITSTGYIPDMKHVRAKSVVRASAEKDGKGVYRTVIWQKL
ncbi:MAG: hypothetical protein ABIH68_07775 [bacterium]